MSVKIKGTHNGYLLILVHVFWMKILQSLIKILSQDVFDLDEDSQYLPVPLQLEACMNNSRW